MKKRDYFKPTKRKIIFSVLITLAWIIINILTAKPVLCDSCNIEITKKCGLLYNLLIIKNINCCSCSNFPELIYQYLLLLIIPFIISYLTYSIIFLITPNHPRIKH